VPRGLLSAIGARRLITLASQTTRNITSGNHLPE
jgi:hypothetical protein